MLGERLGIGIANAINTFDPLEVVIGGGSVSRAGKLLWTPPATPPSVMSCYGLVLNTTIRIARHGPRASVLGAALIAAQEYAEETGQNLQGAISRSTVRIACAFDHAGVPLKASCVETIAAGGPRGRRSRHLVDRPVTTPDTARLAAEAVPGDADRAVLVCGSGAGVAVAPRKFDHPRGGRPRHLHRPPVRRARRLQASSAWAGG